RVANVLQRIRAKQHQVGDLSYLDRSQRFLQAKKLRRIKCGGTQSFDWGQAGDYQQRQFFMQAETGKTKWIAGVCSSQDWHIGFSHRSDDLEIFLESLLRARIITVSPISYAHGPPLLQLSWDIFEAPIPTKVCVSEI